MISHQYKCIFVHIPKCAGTSVESALGHFDGHQGRGGQDHRSIRMIQKPLPLTQLFRSRENIKDAVRRFRDYIRSHANPNNALQVSQSQYQQYYKFTIVREPVSRALSWYKNAMRDPIHQRNYGIPSDIDFNSFIRQFAGQGFLRPQTYWLQEYSGAINMDLIIKFESLEDGFNALRKQLGVEDLQFPHKIESAPSNDHQIDENTIAFIKTFYACDYQAFGY